MMYVYKLSSEAQPWDFAVEFDYSEAMVDAIKDRIPSRLRKWQPETKRWLFRAEVIESVCLLAVLYCGGYQHMEEPAHRTPADPYSVLHLLPTAPPEVVKVVYKCLAKRAHPDRGGDLAQMQQLNAAYAQLTHSHAKGAHHA